LKSLHRGGGRWWLIGTGLVAAAFTVFFVAASSANLTGSTFEGNDGNLVVNTAGNTDWDNAPNLSVGVDLPTGTTDNSFGQGAKEDNVETTVVTGSIPNSKADLARFGVAGETVGSNTFLYLAWSRENQNGTVNFDFEINAQAQPDLTTPGAKTLVRTTGDLLINYGFQGGSSTAALTFRKWTGTAWEAESPISSTCSEGAANTVPVSDTLGGNPPVLRPAGQFGEAAINLVCIGVIQPNTCAPFSSAYVKSRSSTSFNSEIKDFIAPVHLSLAGCGKLTIIKRTNPRGLNQSFNYSTTGGLLPSPGTFSLNDNGNTNADSAGNTRVFDNLQPGTYTVTEGADPSGFSFGSLTCTGAGGSSSGKVATAVIVGGSDITCVYVNNQQLGAIKITKNSIKPNTHLAGGVFSITGPGGYTNSVTTAGADGSVCVDGLAFGTYAVTETAAQTGYDIDDTTSHNVVVDTNTTCATSPYVGETFTATDTPKTDILVRATSQVSGGTASRITCVNAANANVGNSPQPSASTFADPAEVTATGLHPGTYTCVIIIDP
jgi:Prealbumin-like fold domain